MGFDIRCTCRRCAISLRPAFPQLSLLCGCEDCRQALAWGAAQGGRSADPLPHLFYIRSDITNVQGLEFMQPVQLRGEAKSTRVYCTTCYAVLAVDHPGYQDHVFMFFKGHCNTSSDLTLKPSAAIYMNDYRDKPIPDIPADIPVLQSFQDPKDQKWFRALPAVSDSFRMPAEPAEGQCLRELIPNMQPLRVLNLAKGAAV